MNRISFQEVADRIGVNVKTVYRVVNNRDAVSERMRTKVVAELNRNGYMLQGYRKSQLVVLDIQPFPFLENVGLRLMQSLSHSEYNCVVTDHRAAYGRFLEAVAEASILVLISAKKKMLDEIRQVNPDIYIISLLGGAFDGDINIDSDDTEAGALAARHFRAHGHRRIGVVWIRENNNHFARYKSFLAEMLTLDPGARVDSLEFRDGESSLEFWRRFYHRSNHEMPALFCTFGDVAYQLQYYLSKHDPERYERLSILVHDRAEDCRTLPMYPLDTISFNISELIRWAKYFIVNRPLLPASGNTRLLISPRLNTIGSVKNITPEGEK